MTSHGVLVSSLSEAQISELNEKAIRINTMKATKFGLGVFQGKVNFKHYSTSQFHKRSRNCNTNRRARTLMYLKKKIAKKNKLLD